jgi:hypothetical protein
MEKCFIRIQNNLKSSLILALLLMGAVIWVANAAQPPLPTSYWGTVRIAGNLSLMPNTLITVLDAAGNIIASNTSNSDGSYLVIVPWDDPATVQVEGVVAGQTITFAVSGKTVTSRVIDAQGTNNNLDLIVPTTTITTTSGGSSGSGSSGGGGVIVPTATPMVTEIVTGTQVMPTVTGSSSSSETVTETQAMPTVTVTPAPIKKVPGFEFVLTIAILSAAYLFGRMRR